MQLHSGPKTIVPRRGPPARPQPPLTVLRDGGDGGLFIFAKPRARAESREMFQQETEDELGM